MRNRKNSINTQFLYESVVNSMDDGVISKTLDGFITTFNPAAETLFGYTADEVIGKHISIIIPADKLSEENDIISKIKDGHYIGNFLTERVGKDGTVISVSLTLSPIKNTTGKLIGVFTIAKNITDKIAAEKKLEQITQEVSYYKFALIESSIISITDTKGAIIFANDNFSKISKYSVNELIGQDLRIINSGYHPKEYIHSLWTTIAKGNIWRGEFKNKAKDGSFYWVNATIVPFLDGQGEPYQYVVIKEDITERKRAELTIEFEKNNLKALINNTYDLMWSVDRSFNLITSNEGFDEMVNNIIGKSVSPGLGRNLKVFNNKLLKRFKAYYERAFMGEVFTELEHISSPVESWSEISFYPIRRGDEIIGTACHSRDITNIKKSERQVKLNEQRFRAFVESGADTVAILSVKGKPTYVSSTIEKILGYTEEEALQLDFFSMFHKVDFVEIKKVWQQVLANPGIPFPVKPCRIMHKDGTWRWLEGTLNNLLNNDAVNGIVDNFRDVTDKKNAEDLLKLTQFAVDNSGDSVFWMSPDAKIVGINEAACNKLGYTKQELLGLTMHDIDPSCTMEIWNSNYNELRKNKSIFCERIHKSKDGKFIPIEMRANYFQFQGKEYNCAFTRDITDRKQAEEELKKSDEFSRGILNSINSCIAVLNKNGEVIKTNQAWKIMSASAEMSKANFITEGNNFLNILEKGAVAGNVVAKDTIVGLKDFMNERTSIYKNQYYFKPTNTNDEWWFDIVISGFQSQSDMVIINIQDITDLKNIEKERDNTQEANTQLQKIELELSNALAKEKDLNELKSRFVTMASHEFRTPLTTILSSLSLISRYAENADTEGQVKHINKIKISVNNLTDILTDFLSVSKLEEGKIENDPKEINLKNFIGDIVLEMQSTATDGRTIVKKYHAKEMAIFDQKLLKNIMFNLLSNAIKFSKASGIIEVIIEEFEDSIVIAVKDNGIGISKEDQKNLFQRFFRGYNATHIQGTGLGLNIVAKYAEVMKASVTYESIENKGSIFSLKIPQ